MKHRWYESRKELRLALEEDIGHSVTEEQWYMIDPDLEPPYDEKDLEEIKGWLR